MKSEQKKEAGREWQVYEETMGLQMFLWRKEWKGQQKVVPDILSSNLLYTVMSLASLRPNSFH